MNLVQTDLGCHPKSQTPSPDLLKDEEMRHTIVQDNKIEGHERTESRCSIAEAYFKGCSMAI